MLLLNNALLRDLKAQAQRLKATLKVGKEGLSPQFLAALDEVLKHHELVKVKFDEFKAQKKELAPQLAEKSGSHLVTRIGNVVVLYRPKPVEEKPPGQKTAEGAGLDEQGGLGGLNGGDDGGGATAERAETDLDGEGHGEWRIANSR